MLAFHMFCHQDGKRARELARVPFTNYLKSLVDSACDWTEGLSSADYPGYDKIIAGHKASTMDSQIEGGGAWIGSPAEIIDTIHRMQANVAFEHASMQVNFNLIPHAEALRSLRLFASEVMPHFTAERQAKSLPA